LALKDDRRAFELMIGWPNPQWRQRDILFDLVVWENFIDALSKEGLQKRAGRQVRETLYPMASEMRREHWHADKRLMERSIPTSAGSPGTRLPTTLPRDGSPAHTATGARMAGCDW
jgi:hypothetical protein